jgi:predicted lipid-binding transport protein (Tim44 family)
MKRLALLGLPFLIFGLIMASADFADAKRFGGGRSFGSKPSFSRSAPKPSKSFNTSRQSATQTQGKQPRKGLGGLGGMFGGLLAGTLLGSLLFGGGFGGFGMFDLLLVGLGIFLLMRFLRSRRPRASMPGAGPGGASAQAPYQGQDAQFRSAQSAWDNLSSTPRNPMGQQHDPEVGTPAGFDTDDFLKGAKAVYTRLQQSWDARDMKDIREFTTDAVYNEIKAQAEEDPGHSKTEVLLVNARLLEAKQEGDETRATVYYDVMMREDASMNSTEQVREVWHFVRNDQDSSGMWRLDGIQQLED